MVGGQHISVDARVALVHSQRFGHNRWHPDIPPVARVAPGEPITLDLWDGLDVVVTRESRLEDLATLDSSRGHPMTGPIHVEGAEPGDVLEVEILEIVPDDWGYTVVIPGFGLLSDRFDQPFLVKWTIEDGVARSPELPGVAIRGRPFLGVLGVAPSRERLAKFAAREAELAGRGGLVMQPTPVSAVPPSGPAATEGLRTIPPRETGGNMDVKQAVEGATVLLPVDVPGALCSAGDAHFAQGDGESCGVAIEMAATTTLRFGLRKSGWRPRYPAFEFTEPGGGPRRYFSTTGLPIDPSGRNEYLDSTLAARAAFGELVDWLVAERGYSEPQAYVIGSVAADLRISEIVDVPNVIVSAVLPLDIFE